MATWLITGASGLLGGNAALGLAEDHDVVGAARGVPAESPIPFLGVDLGDAASRRDLVARSAASVVLHSAALSSIEACERDPALAHELNVVASADLAAQAAAAGSRFVHISTDAVFDGSQGDYTEESEPSPTTEYGRSKLAGERAVLEANPDALVARVNFYGWSPSGTRSLAEFFRNRLAAGEEAPGFTDVTVSTLYVADLVDALASLVAVEATGVVNVVSGEPTSKYDFGRRLARTLGFDESLVTPATSSQHLAIQRGARLDLRTERMSALLGRAAPGQQQGMDRLAADWSAGRATAVARFHNH